MTTLQQSIISTVHAHGPLAMGAVAKRLAAPWWAVRGDMRDLVRQGLLGIERETSPVTYYEARRASRLDGGAK